MDGCGRESGEVYQEAGVERVVVGAAKGVLKAVERAFKGCFKTSLGGGHFL